MRPYLPEELFKNWAVWFSLCFIVFGGFIIGIGNNLSHDETQHINALNKTSRSDEGQSQNASEIYVRMGFAMLSIGGGGFFSMLVLIGNQRRRREFTYSSILKCLCRTSATIIYTLIEGGIKFEEINENELSSEIPLLALKFQEHSFGSLNAIPESDRLIELIENDLRYAIDRSAFDVSAFSTFSQKIEIDLEYMIANLLPIALELTVDTEIRNHLQKMEDACNMLRIRLQQDDWVVLEQELLEIKPNRDLDDYRSHILSLSGTLSIGDEDIHKDEKAVISYIESTFLEVSRFSRYSGLIIQEMSESLLSLPSDPEKLCGAKA
jgi:hypothetical protein